MRKSIYKTIVMGLLLCAALTGCGGSEARAGESAAPAVDTGADISEAELAEEQAAKLTEEGRDYYYGTNGKERDYNKAFETFEEAVKLDANADAYYYLGAISAWRRQNYTDAVDYLNKAIDGGNSLAKLVLAWRYRGGEGVELDYERSRELIEEAIADGCVEANAGLGDIYQAGYGGEPIDGNKAIEYFTLAAEGSEADITSYALASISEIYKSGTYGIAQDYDKAVEYMEKALAITDNSAAWGTAYKMSLGDRYNDIGNDAKSYECYMDALDLYRELADRGDAYAMNRIGLMYDNGLSFQGKITLLKDGEEAFEWYEKSAEAGFPSAIHNIGYCYENGIGTDVNPDKAIEYYEKAAQLGNSGAYNRIGLMYDKGEIVAADADKALEYYTKAADMWNTTSIRNIAWIYRKGNGVEQDGSKAIEYYTKAADMGDSSAMYEAAYMYIEGDGVEANESEAGKWLERIEKGNYIDQIAAIAKLYANKGDYDNAIDWCKKGVSLDYLSSYTQIAAYTWRKDNDITTTIEWYEKAAEKGHAFSMRTIGEVYLLGTGVDKDETKADEWFQKVADSGNAWETNKIGVYFCQTDYEALRDNDKTDKWLTLSADMGSFKAMENLAAMYLNGWDGVTDYDKAVYWYERAGEAGDTNAYIELAKQYAVGGALGEDHAKAEEYLNKCVNTDDFSAEMTIANSYRDSEYYGEALTWYNRAFGKGSKGAANEIGWIYENGLGVSVDYAQALEWYQKAADMGSAVAWNNVGLIYERGLGVERDTDKALECFLKSYDMGYIWAANQIGTNYIMRGDLQKGREYLQISADAGNEGAQNILKDLEEHSDEEILKLIEEGRLMPYYQDVKWTEQD